MVYTSLAQFVLHKNIERLSRVYGPYFPQSVGGFRFIGFALKLMLGGYQSNHGNHRHWVVKSWQRISWHSDGYFCHCLWSCASQQMICLLNIGINNDVTGVKTSSYWYCLTRIRVAASQICQDILYQDYMVFTQMVSLEVVH